MAGVSYDDEADVLYVEIAEGEVAHTVAYGDLRLVDEAPDGSVLGVEFISASQGIDLSGVPLRSEIEEALGKSDLPIKLVA